MSRTETRMEIDEWDVEICETCGHEEGQHYREPRRVDVKPGVHYLASGCMMLGDQQTGRVLPGVPVANPYRRCHCVEFK